jgi:hypothetical protein
MQHAWACLLHGSQFFRFLTVHNTQVPVHSTYARQNLPKSCFRLKNLIQYFIVKTSYFGKSDLCIRWASKYDSKCYDSSTYRRLQVAPNIYPKKSRELEGEATPRPSSGEIRGAQSKPSLDALSLFRRSSCCYVSFGNSATLGKQPMWLWVMPKFSFVKYHSQYHALLSFIHSSLFILIILLSNEHNKVAHNHMS